jgi:hypothetical protein
MWEVFLYMERLRIHGETSHVWGDFPRMGRLPTYGKTSDILGGVAPDYVEYTPAGARRPPARHLSADRVPAFHCLVSRGQAHISSP